jgi:hypothetical protein
MSQLNFYVPDDVEKEIRLAAQNEGKSISAFLAELVKSKFPSQQWSQEFFTTVFGQWSGEFPEINRALSQQRDDI